MTAPLHQLEGATTLDLIADFFPQLNELIIDGLIVNEFWDGFMDTKLHHFSNSLMRKRGVNVVATCGDCDNEDYGYDCTWVDHYFYFATHSSQSLDLIKKAFSATNLETIAGVFLTLRPGLEKSLPLLVDMVASQVEVSRPLYLSTDIILSDIDMERLLAALKRVTSLMIWRGGEQEEVNEKEVGAVSKILSMLASKDAKGKLTRVSMPKVNLRHPHILIFFHRAFSWLQSLAWMPGGLEGRRWWRRLL